LTLSSGLHQVIQNNITTIDRYAVKTETNQIDTEKQPHNMQLSK